MGRVGRFYFIIFYFPKEKLFMAILFLSTTRCVVNATNAPALSQSFKAMFNLFQFQGG
jgi:hypothetical protein